MKSQDLEALTSWQPRQSPCGGGGRGEDIENRGRGPRSALPRGLEVGVLLSG